MHGKDVKRSMVLAVLIIFFLSAIWPASALDVLPSNSISFQNVNSQSYSIVQDVSASWQLFNHTLRDLRLQSAKNFGTNGVDRIVNALGVAKKDVQGSKLPDAEKSRIIGEIDANVTWFQGKKSAIQSASDVATVKAIGKEANDRWNTIKVDIKEEVSDIACRQYEANIVEARNASAIAGYKIQALKAQGKDTTAMDKKLASYDTHVNNAANDLAKARAEFDKINGPVGADLHYSAGLRQLKLANNEMNNAYSDLKSLYNMLYRNSSLTTI